MNTLSHTLVQLTKEGISVTIEAAHPGVMQVIVDSPILCRRIATTVSISYLEAYAYSDAVFNNTILNVAKDLIQHHETFSLMKIK